MTSPLLLMLADDLTGAADAAGSFARSGRRTLVRFAPGPAEGAEVLALSTHSRHLTPAAAARTQGQALAQAGGWVSGAVYKKIDSTLRGHPAAELGAIVAALGRRRVLVAPAFPSQQRTTIGGHLCVGGFPLEESSFGGEGDLGAVFASLDLPLHLLPLALVRSAGLVDRLHGEGCWLADAEVDADLQRLACASVEAGMDLWCGSAGLAQALGAALWPAIGGQGDLPEPVPGPVLVVAGSRHARTLEQVRVLQRAGAVVAGPECGEAALRAALSGGGNAVLSAAGLSEGEPEQVAAMLAGAAGRLLASGQVGGVVLTGGHTALAVCLGLGSSGIWLRGEIEAGMPWGVLADGPHAGLRVATKAGGFGGPEALMRAAMRLGGGRVWS